LISFQNKTVLIAPLDWGLGHATRCIPIIDALLSKGCQVIIAATGSSKKLLEQEYTALRFIDIPAYHITYGKNSIYTGIKMLLQLPKIKRIIKKENQWLPSIIMNYSIDIVLSDNRYGLYNEHSTCIFITHQLQPKSLLYGIGENFIRKQLYKFINRFHACWVMDYANDNNFAGNLSHPKQMPNIPTHYIGAVTRFKKLEEEILYDVCIVLSGPEPQRTILESKLMQQIANRTEAICFVRGLPQEEKPLNNDNAAITIYAHLPAQELNKVITQSNYIITRSGYTSVMDLLLLQKKCIFIPTPAQTEQEYLAKYLHQKKYCLYYTQADFEYTYAIAQAKTFSFQHPVFPTESALPALLKKLVTNP
jgi:uncharacterized protein (TIGR00661 family)